MNNEIKINVPEGMEIDKENSTFECIKFKPKKKELPKTWEEFCENNPIKPNEYFVSNGSSIVRGLCFRNSEERIEDMDANLLPSKEYAEAMLALCKLIQLRDCYNNGWKPDWKEESYKYVIKFYNGLVYFDTPLRFSSILAFKTKDLMDVFYNNFKDLIEQAKLLL